MNTSLRIFITGGTFDKRYNPLDGSLGFTQSHIPELIKQCRFNAPPAVEELMQIDSLDMQDTHRAIVLKAAQTAPEKAIVITHGTDTMTQTAEVLRAANLGKTVVLTGAMIPLDLAGSDAVFNLGFACAAAQTLPSGIYIAMGGQVFNAGEVAKNRAAGAFEAV